MRAVGVDAVGVVVRSGRQSPAGSATVDGGRARVRGVCVESVLRSGGERRQDVRRVGADRLRRAAAAARVPRARSSTDSAVDLREVATLALSAAARPLAATLLPGE